MDISYLYGKFFKKILRGKCVINSQIHKTAKINSGATIVDSTIGRYTYTCYDDEIVNCEIGQFCSISDDVIIGGAEHPMDWVSTSPVFQDVKHSGPKKRFSRHHFNGIARTYIGNDVWIGKRVIVKAGVKIGDGAVIGAGAVVTKDVPPYAVVAGVPAKVLKYRFDEETIQSLLKSEWWNLDDSVLENKSKSINNVKEFCKWLIISKLKWRGGGVILLCYNCALCVARLDLERRAA